MDPTIILITGIMAAGKSTVAQSLAQRFPKSVHLRGDLFRRMMVNGEAAITPDLSPEAEAQLRLRYRLAAQAAAGYYDAGFTVVFQDIIVGEMLTEVVSLILQRPLYLVVLCPSAEVVAMREAERAKTGYRGFTPQDLDAAFRAETPHIGLWLDSSSLTVAETVDTILDHLPDAQIP